MRDLRGEEQWALELIARELGLPVTQHDDGSRPGMHDLDILNVEGDVVGAVEVVAAADAASIELWNVVNGGDRWIADRLTGGWSITLEPTARARRLKAELPVLLEEFERSGVTEASGEEWSRRGARHDSRLTDLRIVHAWQGGTDLQGSIYLTIEQPAERVGGFVSAAPQAVSPWLTSFLGDQARRDVLDKLARSGREERHAFIILPTFSTAPFGAVELLLQGMGGDIPTAPPSLPVEVTHVWLVSMWATGSGLRLTPNGWQRYSTEIGESG